LRISGNDSKNEGNWHDIDPHHARSPVRAGIYRLLRPAPAAASLKELSGGWTRKQAAEFKASIIVEYLARAQIVFVSPVVLGELIFGFRNGSRFTGNMEELEMI
jgi:hypothetical protein